MSKSIGMLQTALSVRGLLCFAAILICGSAGAQTQTIPIWPGVAPGSENWKEKESVMKGADTDRILNVVTPTLTVYLPEKSKATGTGVIISPGGGFSYLAIDKEGHMLARWLQEKGIAGFVLKYRTRQMTAEEVQALAAEPALQAHRVADAQVPQANPAADAQEAGAVAWTLWGSGALPTEFRPSRCCGSVQPSSVSLLTGSASWASPPGQW